jgi:hypothetical protein
MFKSFSSEVLGETVKSLCFLVLDFFKVLRLERGMSKFLSHHAPIKYQHQLLVPNSFWMCHRMKCCRCIKNEGSLVDVMKKYTCLLASNVISGSSSISTLG